MIPENVENANFHMIPENVEIEIVCEFSHDLRNVEIEISCEFVE